MTDEELIKAAFLLKEEEDEELEELLTESEILFVTLMLALIFDYESAMDDILEWDYENIYDIVENLLGKYPNKAPSERVIQRRLNKRPFIKEMNKTVTPIGRESYHKYYESFNRHYKSSGKHNYRSKQYKDIEKWLNDLPKKMKLTTDKRVIKLIRQSYEEGKGVKWLENQLANCREFSRARARITAITENRRMYHAAQYQSFLDNDSIVTKEWKHTHGIKEPRPMHVKADGQTVPKDEPFIINGHECLYPLDPNLPPEESISCHCYMIPGIEGE